jgi:hypothetical protein
MTATTWTPGDPLHDVRCAICGAAAPCPSECEEPS